MLINECQEIPEEFSILNEMNSFPSEEDNFSVERLIVLNPYFSSANKKPELEGNVTNDSLTSHSQEEVSTKLSPANSSELPMNSEKNWDNFRLRRDCFRGFSDYFKKAFKPLGDLWQGGKRNKLKKVQMRPLVERFL